jgi:hypothetical protein
VGRVADLDAPPCGRAGRLRCPACLREATSRLLTSSFSVVIDELSSSPYSGGRLGAERSCPTTVRHNGCK